MTAPAAIRAYYAQLISGKAGTDDVKLIEALGIVERERFVGTGPWKVNCFAGGYVETPSDDPSFIYQDVVVAIDADRGINNGEPHLHARCLAALQVRQGETAIHVGTGTGYYTGILAHLVGAAGVVHAYEIEQDLAMKAQANLAPWPWISVKAQSAAEGSIPACDIIYVSAGATRPLNSWLNALRPGGRLLFPLTPRVGLGGMLLVTRSVGATFAARFLQTVAFIPCMGARDDDEADKLGHAFERGNLRDVKSLRRGVPPDASSWFSGKDWWLSSDP